MASEHTYGDDCLRTANDSGDDGLILERFGCGHSYLVVTRPNTPLGTHMLPVTTSYREIICAACHSINSALAAEEDRLRQLDFEKAPADSRPASES